MKYIKQSNGIIEYFVEDKFQQILDIISLRLNVYFLSNPISHNTLRTNILPSASLAFPEAKVNRRVKDFLKMNDIYFTMPFTAGYGASGVPDILVCHKGKFIAIECKAGKNKPTALQAQHMKRSTATHGQSSSGNATMKRQLRSWLPSRASQLVRVNCG
mgnify:CR=1 FL=1